MLEFGVFFTSVKGFAGHAANVVDEIFALLNDERNVQSDMMDEQLMKFLMLQAELDVLESLIHTLRERTEQFKELKDITYVRSIRRIIQLFLEDITIL